MAPQPDEAGTIELHLRDSAQLFNSMDPSPFHERDLDKEAEEFIFEYARELPPDSRLEIVIHVDTTAQSPESPQTVQGAIASHFRRRSDGISRQLRQLFRQGRASLAIGLSCVVATVLGSELVIRLMGEGAGATIIRESLLIGGWVAMWRPMEIFLYDWWPIRNQRRIYDRLASAEVDVRLTRAHTS